LSPFDAPSRAGSGFGAAPSAYLHGLLGWSSVGGAAAVAEIGVRPFESLTLFARGALSKLGPEAGLGARFEF
jgi:hypothetical protein